MVFALFFNDLEHSALMNPSASHNADRIKPTILVVDDEFGPRDALKVILRPFFNIRVAENAQSALHILNNEAIDLITLDQKLPDRHGIDLLQEIKQAHAEIEIIIITGYGSVKSAMDGLRYGAAGYLLKPFNVTELISLINQTIEKKQRLDLIRTILHDPSSPLWGSEQDCARAWGFLKTAYFAIGNKGHEAAHGGTTHQDLLPLLSDLLEAKDRRLLNHSSRVSFYATLLANRLNLSGAEQRALALGAFLHDIGELGLRPGSRPNNGSLTAAESSYSKEHAELGARMILPLGFPAEVGQIISYHHEHWDGTGYPHGLQGEGIPLLARIVGLAQQFDHLTSESLTPLSLHQALQHITRLAGTHFDPQLTKLFTRIVSECKTSLPAMANITASSSTH